MLLIGKRIRLPLTGNHSPWQSKTLSKGYLYLGLVLLTAFALQEYYAWRWPWLGELQADDLYKQLSGFALIAFLCHQWHCSILRNQGLMREAGQILRRHKWVGSLAPLIFYAHSQTLGFTYHNLLSLVFFGIFLTGLFNFETTRIRRPWFQPIWITLHVGLSTAFLFLIGYHIYISYAYS